jgi:hypothetical protein
MPPSMSRSIQASLCPPPAKLIARIGFQPTNAAANALRRAAIAAIPVIPRAAAAASARNRNEARSADRLDAFSTTTDAAVNPGP